jgi:hypothetical protein
MDTRLSIGGVAGWGTSIALIVGTLNIISPDRRALPNAPPKAASSGSVSGITSDSSRPRTAITGAQLLRQFLGTDARDTVAQGARYELGILFVTVPDPVDSHLDWAYDVQLNAVRRALERDSYVIDLFWVPWGSGVGAAGNGRADQEIRTTQPGVLLFRRSDPNDRRLRLIYIVGEIPTAGVHKSALLTALREADSLLVSTGQFVPDPTMGPEVRIVGPTFSGSAPSLRRALDEWERHRTGAVPAIRVITGSASNTQNKKTLENSHTMFSATVHDDRTLSRFQTEVLARRMRILPRETAILRETSTQYGQLTDRRETSLDSASLEIPFPMHISELRAEYARNPDQLILGPTMPGDRTSVRLPVHLDEKPRVADGPQLLSELSPPTVDAMIDDIARTLNAHRIKAVGILATDARDVIFLGTEVRKRVRDVLLFTYGSNTLYARRDVSEWLRGMIVVSTYPVTVESQFWDVTQADRQRVSFSGDMAEGMYNAVLMQLGSDAARAVVDYVHPLAHDRVARPPVWVTTVGRSSMLPVTALRDRASRDPGSSRPVITPNANYLAGRVLDTIPPDTIKKLIRGQEGRGSAFDVIVFALLAGIVFAWVLRDQLATTPEERHRDKSSRLWVSPAVVVRRLNRQLEPLELLIKTDDWTTEWTRLNRFAQAAALLAQQEMYIILRVASLAVAAIGTLFLLFRTRAHASATAVFTLAGVGLATGLGIYVIACSAWRLMTILTRTRVVRRAYNTSPLWRSRIAKWMWRAETIGRALAFSIGVGCFVVSMWLVFDVALLDPVAARSFFYRSTAITAGVSPAIPLLVAGVLFYAWSVWNSKRIALLFETTAFEQLFLDSLSERRPEHADDRGTHEELTVTDELVRSIERDPGPRLASPVLGVPAILSADERRLAPGPAVMTPDTEASPLAVVRMVSESAAIQEHVRQVRVRLFLSVPGAEGVVMFVVLAFLAAWAWTQFNSTIEAILLPTHFGLTSFDVLLRVSLLSAIGATIFGVYRLVGTWLALRDTLRALADTPLVYAFERLPATVTRLTRLSPIDQPSDALIDAMLARKWRELQCIGRSNVIEQDASTGADGADAHELSDPAGLGTAPPPPRFATLLEGTLGRRLGRLYRALETAWARWPDASPAVGSQWESGQTVDAAGAGRKKTAPGAESADAIRELTPKERWLRIAGQCGAIYVIEYIEWVLHHLRNLAGFLMLSIILITLLLGSYAFQPESALKAIFFAVSVATVSGLVFVLLQMNRNDILSLITRTDPGRLSWDGAFTLNLALYITVPLVTLLSSELPEVRGFLFSWVSPLLRALGKG